MMALCWGRVIAAIEAGPPPRRAHARDRMGERAPYRSLVTDVDVFIDPSCPWAWNVSRWLRAVAPQRDLSVSWRSYCLEIRDEGAVPSGVPEANRRAMREGRALAHRMLRVFEAARATVGEEAVDRLYTEWGRRFIRGHENPDAHWLSESVDAAGLDANLLTAADDEAWDAQILASMHRAYSFGGPKTQTPVVVIAGDPPRGLKGPVIAAVPTGDAALRLWDAVDTLSAEPGFFELTRPRTSPPRPAPAD